MRALPAFLCALLVVALAPAGHGQNKLNPNRIVVVDPWVQEVPPVSTNSAAYMKIENHSTINTAIVSAHSDAARVVEIHEMAEENGMMMMRKVSQVELGAHRFVLLQPGGYHVMLIDLKRKLKEGDQVNITLVLKDGVEKTITAPVRKYENMVQ